MKHWKTVLVSGTSKNQWYKWNQTKQMEYVQSRASPESWHVRMNRSFEWSNLKRWSVYIDVADRETLIEHTTSHNRKPGRIFLRAFNDTESGIEDVSLAWFNVAFITVHYGELLWKFLIFQTGHDGHFYKNCHDLSLYHYIYSS